MDQNETAFSTRSMHSDTPESRISAAAERTAVLLLNLGTPASARVADVRRYLREFLMDARVLDVPAIARWFVVHGAILPFRPRQSAAAYAKIWQADGSPLLTNGIALTRALEAELGPSHTVELGMRYGAPSIADALGRLRARATGPIVVAPLFPQFAASSWSSALDHTYGIAARAWDVPALQVIPPYYDRPEYIDALVESAREPLREFAPDHVLLSYHGLPERQIRRSDPTGTHCLQNPRCCVEPSPAHSTCYRAQCYATSRALVHGLRLPEGSFSTSFQSRLGRTPWIRPFTDHVLPELAQRGVRRLAVLCPSFTADCLETLEEIGMRGREQWQELGGKELLLVPCLNAHPHWVRALAGWIRALEPRAGN
jgi:protoporphyrin/coproporphyrin ferrochelatase